MKPKIGWVVPGFSASEADWCIPALLDTARVLAETHELHIFTLRYPPEPRTYTVYGAQVHAFGGGTTARIGRLMLMARVLSAILTEHRQGKFSALHGIWADEPGFVAVMAGRLLRVPTVVSLMGGELVNLPEIGYGHQLSRIAHWMIDNSLRAAKLVTVGSSLLAEQARAYGLNDEKLCLTPLGVDETLFHLNGERAEIGAGTFHLVHAASLEPIKNQAMLLRAFAQVHDACPGAHLHLLGDGRLRADLMALSASLGLENAVTFHGNIAHEQLPVYFRAADLCVLTSFHESQSMVALEAASCGRATVGTRVGILPELVRDDLLVAPHDADGLATVLIRLVQDSTLLQQINASAHNSAQQNPLTAAVNRWGQCYAHLSP